MVLLTFAKKKVDRTESDKQQFKPCLEDSIVLNREHLNKKKAPQMECSFHL